MKFDVMLTGVGGMGVLTMGVIIARAANLEGHYVRGVQFHGLAQRGGTIPTAVRFGSKKEIASPDILQGDADLVIAFEPLEAMRATKYASKEKTSFVINNCPAIPVHSHILNIPYPAIQEIVKRLKPFAKETIVFDAGKIAKQKFGLPILGNTIILGVALGAGLLPLKEETLRKVISASAPRLRKENLAAFKHGIKLGQQAKKK